MTWRLKGRKRLLASANYDLCQCFTVPSDEPSTAMNGISQQSSGLINRSCGKLRAKQRRAAIREQHLAAESFCGFGACDDLLVTIARLRELPSKHLGSHERAQNLCRTAPYGKHAYVSRHAFQRQIA